MLDEKHRGAEVLSAAAADALAAGRSKEALELYAHAARAEDAALSEVAPNKTRTRSILALSVVSLLYKAQLLAAAEIRAFQLLGAGGLEEWANRKLGELLQVISDESAIATSLHLRYSGESITVALRGGEIGSGTGPLDLILEKAAGLQTLLYRFAEWVGDYPLRMRGSPPKELMDLIQARASEPVPGSYRLEIRLTEPLQTDLFVAPRVQPRAVIDAMFEFLTKLTEGVPGQLEILVPRTDYRKALLQLTRSVAPTGKRLKEIGIYRRVDDRLQSVHLTDALPSRIRDTLPHEEERVSEPRGAMRGVLRALHLDRNWLELSTTGGQRVRCDTVHDMLDDVVGPMVNREVVVSGRMRLHGVTRRLLVEEIELVEEG
jgi:hypothetical protein